MTEKKGVSGGRMKGVMSAGEMTAVLEEMGSAILDVCGEDPPRFVGILSRGVPLSHRLGRIVSSGEREISEYGELDIALYRDDFTEGGGDWPEVRGSRIPFDIAGKTIILVDDVLFTGRTIRAALNALMDYGRPKKVLLAVLIDRGGRELPIQADFVGKRIEVGEQDHVRVRLREVDGEDGVVIFQRRKGGEE
ncbi:MAG: bifunctional pyr operon transcriptional regulator/uracil phosphoribosyltransferase PyrR [Candidatus Hydrogenedentota bacterium]|nr:MAG: bifunctional pyr operon transcriptional regulator/uracil phosphoribosyltransferase PyrR [Candidatus Hydrogenedentota bacterium]